MADDAKFCPACGNATVAPNSAPTQAYNPQYQNPMPTQGYQPQMPMQGYNPYLQAPMPGVPTHHPVPKCTYCGHIDEWEVGPLFRTMDYILGIAFTMCGVVPGLIYFGIVGVVRSNKDNREKYCKKCGAKNMFTNVY